MNGGCVCIYITKLEIIKNSYVTENCKVYWRSFGWRKPFLIMMQKWEGKNERENVTEPIHSWSP